MKGEMWGAIDQRPGNLATLNIYYRRPKAPPEERSRLVLDSAVFDSEEAARAHLHEFAQKWRTCFDG